jgi:predicted AlkP superfamily phosphohydrolase/phosphomutase
LAALAPDAAVMLMSDHGGGFNQRGAEYLNDWLASLGFLHTVAEQPAIAGRLRQAAAAPLRWGYELLDHSLSRPAKLRLVRLLPGVREQMETMLAFGDIDWSRTQAYAYGSRDDIWINLQGREPHGIVPPSQYDALRDQIIGYLYATRDVADHEPVLETAMKRESVYSGPYLDKAPDILIRWQTTRVIRGLYVPGKDGPPPQVPPLRPNLNNGGHRLHGIFVMAGPGVRQGHTMGESLLWDLAPTILHYLGVPIPDDMDGTVLQEAFKSEWLQSHPVRFAAPGEAHAEAADYADDEEAIIERRLRGLGYVQ